MKLVISGLPKQCISYNTISKRYVMNQRGLPKVLSMYAFKMFINLKGLIFRINILKLLLNKWLQKLEFISCSSVQTCTSLRSNWVQPCNDTHEYYSVFTVLYMVLYWEGTILSHMASLAVFYRVPNFRPCSVAIWLTLLQRQRHAHCAFTNTTSSSLCTLFFCVSLKALVKMFGLWVFSRHMVQHRLLSCFSVVYCSIYCPPSSSGIPRTLEPDIFWSYITVSIVFYHVVLEEVFCFITQDTLQLPVRSSSTCK